MQLMLGHEGPPTNFWDANLVTGQPLTECPLRTILRATEVQPALVREVARHMDEHYPAFEAGHLLVAGGTADQPARYIAFMTAIRTLRAAQQAKWDDLNKPEIAAPPPRIGGA